MSEFNLPLLRKAVEWAESEARKPERESEWFQGSFLAAGAKLGRTCETAYCIAGYVTTQAGEPNDWDVKGPNQTAQELLGITADEAWGDTGLFNSFNSIEDVREAAECIARNHGKEL